MSAQEIADRLGVAERTVRRWIERGEIDATKRGRAFEIRLSDAERLYESRVTGSARRAHTLTRLAADRDAELLELRGRYLEISDRLARVEAELVEERRRNAELSFQVSPKAA